MEQDTTPQRGQCAWCGEPAVDDLIISAGRSRRKTAPACRTHVQHFAKQDVITVSREVDLKHGGSSR